MIDAERLSEVVTAWRHYLAVESPRLVEAPGGSYIEFDGFLDFAGVRHHGTRGVRVSEVVGYAYRDEAIR